MKKILTIVTMLLMAAFTVQATTDDIIVEKAINVTQRVHVTPETEKVVLFLDLSPGTWSVNAELNLFVTATDTTRVYFAGFLGLVPSIDYQNGRTAFGSEQVFGRADPIIPLVGRRVVVDTPPGTTKRLYLMTWVHTTSGDMISNAEVYGFAYATRIAP